MTNPVRSPILRFNTSLLGGDLAKARDNVSAVVLAGEHLWLGGDEGTSIDRMTRDARGHFGNHVRFELNASAGGPLALAMPTDENTNEEIDIEGLAVDGGYLWFTGSHSAKRKKYDPGKSDAKNLERFRTVEIKGNRFTLARVPLAPDGTPAASVGTLTAARLDGDATGNLLTAALESDQHLGRFLPPRNGDVSRGIPSKDNGFDVEGLAVAGNRLFLGLRGPVLRGWAVILELRVSEASAGVLALDPIGPGGTTYIKHFIELDGLGVRELVVHGGDLLILAGPSMDLDGPVFIYRWKDALATTTESLTRRQALTVAVTVPFGAGTDHAEGITIAETSPLSVLVSYDSPQPLRIDGEDGSGVKMDLFAI